jgi:hypothetical protein
MPIQTMDPPRRERYHGRPALYTDAQIDEIANGLLDGRFVGDHDPIMPTDGTPEAVERAKGCAYQRGAGVRKRLAERGIPSDTVRVSAWRVGEGFVWAVGPK